MRKRGGKGVIFGSLVQIFLLVSMSFAVAFLISEEIGIVSAFSPISTVPASTTSPNTPDVPKAAVATTPTKTGTLSKIFGGGSSVSERIVTPSKSFSFKPETTGDFKVYIDKEVDHFGELPNGGAKVYYKDGTAADTLTSEQYASTKSAATSEGVGFTGQKEYKLLGTTLHGGTAHLVQGLSWSLFVVGAIQLIGNVAGLGSQTTNALSIAAFAGIMAGKGLAALSAPSGGFNIIKSGILTKPLAQFGVGVLVAAAVFILLYKKEKKQLISFQCLPWEPQIGGQKCEECNKDSFRPCSEYRCKSLGQACQLLNPGTKEEKCAWVNPKDVNSPTITPWTDALKPSGLKYIADTSVRPPALGVKVVSSGSSGCLPAFTPLQFGVLTNEPSQCKADYNHTSSFDSMQYFFGESNYYLYNHTQKMRLPGPNSADVDLSPLLNNDGNFALYVRCRDANGNANVDEYSMSFCVDKGPDTTPPVIEGFSIPSGSPITFNQQTISLDTYINEPSECKWSVQSKSYADMENSMLCGTQAFEINAQLQYICSANLTGIKNKEDNKFYFRCKDQPGKPENERNVNVQSTEFVLKGSQPLNILSTGPNETIFGSVDVVPVNLEAETDDGAQEGKAICYYSPTGAKDSYIAMFESNNFKHKQILQLANGDYKYYFRCVDAGGNAAESITSFAVFVDKQAPKVTRAYKQEGLKIVTDEDAECRYSLTSCNYNFNEGLKMIYSNPDQKKNLFAEWKTSSTYYIKCSDAYGNQPEPNKCSIVVSAVELEGQQGNI